MWMPVARGDFPFWALDLNSLWQHKTGNWLSSRVTSYSTLWELRAEDGRVITNQLELPFREGLDGAPVSWANLELQRERGSANAQP
jgi:hypothetical protein